MDSLALAVSLFIGPVFTICLLAYILASRAYSYRGIRLKQYPIAGYLIVIVFQGALVFFMTYHGSSNSRTLNVPMLPVLASSLLIGGFYPLTQIYQHEADLKDGVRTISYKLGYRGTFIFTAVIYVLAMLVLAQYFYRVNGEKKLLILATCLLPVLVYFFSWAAKVWKDVQKADFFHTMRMNLVASVCTNLAFLILLIRRFFE